MKQDCEHYDTCRKPVRLCNGRCPDYRRAGGADYPRPVRLMVWAIADTDGDRMAPVPLVRHLYATREAAEQARRYFGFDPRYYPLLQVEVRA